MLEKFVDELADSAKDTEPLVLLHAMVLLLLQMQQQQPELETQALKHNNIKVDKIVVS